MIHTIDGNTSAKDGSNNNGGEVAPHSRPFSDVLAVGALRSSRHRKPQSAPPDLAESHARPGRSPAL